MISGCFSDIENAQQVVTIQCLEPLFENVVRAVISISAVGVFIVLLVGGFNFLFSGGDQKKLEQARGAITNSVIGLVVITVAYLILNTIKVITGVDVSTFEIPRQ